MNPFVPVRVGGRKNWKRKVSENACCEEEQNEPIVRESERKWRNACETHAFWTFLDPGRGRGDENLEKEVPENARCREEDNSSWRNNRRRNGETYAREQDTHTRTDTNLRPL